MKRLKKILIVGLGSIGNKHLEVIRSEQPDSIIKIFSRNPYKKIPNLANGLISSIQDISIFQPDIAVISNPSTFHIEICEILIKYKCNLLIEKPLSNSEKSVDKLIKKIEKANLVCHIAYNLKFIKSLQYFKKMINKNLVGDIFYINCKVGQFLPNWRTNVDYKKSVSANKELGGGVLLELSHELDYLAWIFGDANWVSAWIGRTSNLEINVEDTAFLTLSYPKFKTSTNILAQISMDFVRRDTKRGCEVIGDIGTLKWDAIDGSVEFFNPKKNTWQILYKDKEPSLYSYVKQWKLFYKCVEDKSYTFNNSYEAFKVLKIITAIRRSNKNDNKREYVKYN